MQFDSQPHRGNHICQRKPGKELVILPGFGGIRLTTGGDGDNVILIRLSTSSTSTSTGIRYEALEHWPRIWYGRSDERR